ncbi:MAG: cytochrome c1 [Alphaproteobacteria bacterium]|nr:cytochrome c1 [Alphaproteobacteria bacterium]
MRVLSVIFIILFSSVSIAAEAPKPKKMVWQFDGFTGTFDRKAVQRGYQIYREVCSACHALSRISYRNLAEIGFSEAEIKEIARQYQVTDGPNDEGEMFERPGTPTDRFVSPFKNEQAARAANGGAYPGDLSLIIKARHDGPNYLYSLLTGYQDPPEGFNLMEGLHYNKYFPGHQLAMPSPLSEGSVTYQDGTKATLDQMAYDVTNFLQWASEPEMEKRKSMGLKVMIYLVIFTIFFYFTKKRIWGKLKGK